MYPIIPVTLNSSFNFLCIQRCMRKCWTFWRNRNLYIHFYSKFPNFDASKIFWSWFWDLPSEQTCEDHGFRNPPSPMLYQYITWWPVSHQGWFWKLHARRCGNGCSIYFARSWTIHILATRCGRKKGHKFHQLRLMIGTNEMVYKLYIYKYETNMNQWHCW